MESNSPGRPPHNIALRDMELIGYLTNSTAFFFALDLLTHPFEVLKIRQQYDLNTGEQKLRIFREARRIVKTEGIRGLYRGLWPSTIGQIPGQTMFFTSFELFHERLTDMWGHDTYKKRALACIVAGVAADAASQLLHVPFEIISQRMIAPSHTNNVSLSAVIRDIARVEGFRGFYRGLSASVAYFGPLSALWWASYDAAKTGLCELRGPGANPLPNFLAAGAIAGGFSTTLMNPMDVVRVRFQTLDAANIHDASQLRKGFLRFLLQTAVRERFTGLMRGLSPRLAVSIPYSALIFSGYEVTKMTALKNDL